jgi:outer membrane protein assembly factor BamA
VARYSKTKDNAGRFIAPLRDTLLGGRDFGQLGGRLRIDLDTRDRPVYPRHGFRLGVAGEVEPGIWDVPRTYGSGEVTAEAFASAASLPGKPTLAVRGGSRRVWGDYPFFESAFLGGASTLPGYHTNRFAGDASVYGGAELRLTVGHTSLAIPAVWGVYGNVGAGRVYLDGNSPGGWHSGGGGGVWLALLNNPNAESVGVPTSSALSFGVATSSEGTLLQGGVAFGF